MCTLSPDEKYGTGERYVDFQLTQLLWVTCNGHHAFEVFFCSIDVKTPIYLMKIFLKMLEIKKN